MLTSDNFYKNIQKTSDNVFFNPQFVPHSNSARAVLYPTRAKIVIIIKNNTNNKINLQLCARSQRLSHELGGKVQTGAFTEIARPGTDYVYGFLTCPVHTYILNMKSACSPSTPPPHSDYAYVLVHE